MTQALTYIVRPTTEEEKSSSMPYLTSSMLEAVNTCPKWGIIRNVLNKTFVTNYRSMALEAGSTMHDVLATLNLFQVAFIQLLPDHTQHHGRALFGDQRWEMIWSELQQSTEKGVFAAIATSDFYDDPSDRNRTVANLEHAALELCDYWTKYLSKFNIYISAYNDPTAPIGIEYSLDVVYEVIQEDGPSLYYRTIGLADILYYNEEQNKLTLGEYKTTSSMQDSWLQAFRTRHQITNYYAALKGIFSSQHVVNDDVLLIGSAIPVRKTSAPVQHFPVPRHENNVHDFIRTMIHTSTVVAMYRDTPLLAPMFTHSCSRFFKPCPQLDLCDAEMSDQEVMFEQMVEKETLSPSEEKALLRRE